MPSQPTAECRASKKCALAQSREPYFCRAKCGKLPFARAVTAVCFAPSFRSFEWMLREPKNGRSDIRLITWGFWRWRPEAYRKQSRGHMPLGWDGRSDWGCSGLTLEVPLYCADCLLRAFILAVRLSCRLWLLSGQMVTPDPAAFEHTLRPVSFVLGSRSIRTFVLQAERYGWTRPIIARSRDKEIGGMRAQATVSRRTGRSMNPALPIVLRVLLALVLAVLATRPLHADDGNTSVQAPIPVQTRIIVQSGHSAPISAAAWMPDGKFVLTGSTDGQLLVWDLAGRVVSRTQLGTRGYRTIVERIVANPDGRGAMVDEIQFRDMYDNGVASEVHRRHYAVVFGQDRVEPLQDEQIDPPWSSEQSFYEGSLTLKSRLMAQGQWPASKLGWTLLWRDGQLTLQSPGSAAPIVLRGTLGYAPDEGDARMEVRARKLETLAGAIQRNAALSVKCRH